MFPLVKESNKNSLNMTPRLRPCTSCLLIIMKSGNWYFLTLMAILQQMYDNKVICARNSNYLNVRKNGGRRIPHLCEVSLPFFPFSLERNSDVIDLQTVTLNERSFCHFGLYEYNCFDFDCCRATRIMTFYFYILQHVTAMWVLVGGNVFSNIHPHYCAKVGRLGWRTGSSAGRGFASRVSYMASFRHQKHFG